jgi:uncharacterized protein with PIN domain
MGKRIRWTKERVVERLDELGFDLVGEYVGRTNEPQGLKDRVCGHEWNTTLHNVLKENGTRCPKCSGKAPIPVDEVNKKLDKLGFDLVGEYVGTVSKPQGLKSRVCGHEWKARISNVFHNGTGCPKCSKVEQARKQSTPVERVVKQLDELGFDLVGEYVGTVRESQRLKDRVCGHEWKTHLSNVFKENGTRCPKCSGGAPISVDEATKRLDELGFDLVGEYVGTTKEPQGLKDRVCGHEWKTALSHVFTKNGSRCPKCSGVAPISVDETTKMLDELGFDLVGEYVGTITAPQGLKDRVCGHEWKTNLSNVFKENGTRCPNCVREPWFRQGVYHLQHPDVPYAYIGISTKPILRLDEHRKDLGERGELARTIDKPKELTYREVRDVFEHATAVPASVRDWFANNADGDLPKGWWWFHSWSAKTMDKPARVPHFVADWVETALIEQWSLKFKSTNPFVQAGKVRLLNKLKNTPEGDFLLDSGVTITYTSDETTG